MTSDYQKWMQQTEDTITGGRRFWKRFAPNDATKPVAKSEARANRENEEEPNGKRKQRQKTAAEVFLSLCLQTFLARDI